MTEALRYEDLIVFPDLEVGSGTLTPTERALLAHFMMLVRPRLVLELGVFEARTTRFMCQFMACNHIEGRVVGFDLEPVVAGLLDTNEEVKALVGSSQLELVPGKLPAALRNWLKQHPASIDFALVDATHDYRSVVMELGVLWPHLAPDGIILCHDYSEKYDGVRYAVDTFATRHRAMVLPLTTSQRARDAGHGSVLVAIRRRPYALSYQRWGQHIARKIKLDMRENRYLRQVWHRLVKPMVRRVH